MPVDPEKALVGILEGTARETGDAFFRSLVRNLAGALGAHGAWVTEYDPGPRKLRALAFWMGSDWLDGWEMVVDGTPCELVVSGRRLVHLPDNVLALYPDDPDVRATGAVSYMGVPLLDGAGEVMGHLAILDLRPMPADPGALAVFRIFAARAAAELQRMRAESAVREREAKLARLVDGAMDGIFELDASWRVVQANAAGRKILGGDRDPHGRDFRGWIVASDRPRAEALAAALARGGDSVANSAPISLTMSRDGDVFDAEATLSFCPGPGGTAWILTLRDVRERVEAERRIRALSLEAEDLRRRALYLWDTGRIVGDSPAVRELKERIDRVGPSDAAVLIHGETGAGKELVAHAIHAASRRADRPLVKVNCAAIAPQLVESEFFGHEKGAFTGATARREGRFAAADGGTIFLDEIGELPLELQPKLLRVLQEGEFEPVGSSRTRRVDARVVAATNRDLAREVREGRFREDLFYRLGVFPLHVPPLRERGDDVVELARGFAEEIARQMGRPAPRLDSEAERRLKAYHWPGNVRELRNAVERALILRTDGVLRPDVGPPPGPEAPAPFGAPAPDPGVILTADQLRDLEKRNIEAALERSGGRVQGPGGAAELLGLNPSTLNSRIRALGLRKDPGRE